MRHLGRRLTDEGDHVVDWDEFFDSTLVRGSARATARDSSRDDSVVTWAQPLPRDPIMVDLWRRGTGRLAALRHEHVVAMVSYRIDREMWQVEHGAPTGMLPATDWFPEGSIVTAGQVVTLGSALARGLAALHQSGVCRDGELSMSDIVVDREGRPAWKFAYAVPRTDADASNDVAALAQLLRDTMSQRTAPGALTLTLLRAEDDDPRNRPAASQLAESLLAACAPTALSWPPIVESRAETAFASAEEPEPEVNPWPPVVSRQVIASEKRGGRRLPGWLVGSRWRFVAFAVVGVMVAVGVMRGMNSQARAEVLAPTVATSSTIDSVSPSPLVPSLVDSVVEVTSDPPTETVTESIANRRSPAAFRGPEIPWSAVLAALDAARTQAFVKGAIDQLNNVDAADSAALKSDQAALSTLKAAGLTPRGLSVELMSVTEVSRTTDTVNLQVVDRASAYDLVDVGGTVNEHHNARGDTTWAITLVAGSTLGSWRISQVVAAKDVASTAR